MSVQLRRKAFLLKHIGLPIPLKKKSTFNFSQTVGEMVFVSFEAEKMRMFLVQSIVRWCWAVMGCCSLLSRVKDRFQLVPVSWPSCRQQASLFTHGHGIAAFPILLQILLLFQILGHRCRISEGIKHPPF